MAQSDQNGTIMLRDYWRVLWLRRRLIVASVILFTLVAFVRASSQSEVYVASAQMMYDPPPNVASAVLGSTDSGSISYRVQSVVNTVNSPAVVERASSGLSESDAEAAYTVSATLVAPSNEVMVSDVVIIEAQASSPDAAAAIANAYAVAIIDLRKESQRETWRAAQEIIQGQLDLFTTPQSKLTGTYATLSQQLQNLQVAEAAANGDFRVILPATPPTSPASPKPAKSAVFGSIAGLFFGMVVAFVVAQFDTRVRSHRAVSNITGLPVLGRVPRMTSRQLSHGGLVASADPEGSASEALRVLSRNLEWSGVDGSLKSILVTSFAKGEGKTLTLCNLAVTLARAGSKVIIVDADLRNPKVHRVFGLSNATGLTAVAFGKMPLSEAIGPITALGPSAPAVRTAASGIPSPLAATVSGTLSILTSGPVPPNPGEVVASRSVAGVLETLVAADADYVLIDTPPLLAFGDVGALAPSVDGLLVTVRIDKARRPILEEGREALESLPGRKIGVVVVGERLDHSHYATYADSGSGR